MACYPSHTHGNWCSIPVLTGICAFIGNAGPLIGSDGLSISASTGERSVSYCISLKEHSIIESGFRSTVKPVSDSLGKSNGILAVNNVIRGKQTVTSYDMFHRILNRFRSPMDPKPVSVNRIHRIILILKLCIA